MPTLTTLSRRAPPRSITANILMTTPTHKGQLKLSIGRLDGSVRQGKILMPDWAIFLLGLGLGFAFGVAACFIYGFYYMRGEE